LKRKDYEIEYNKYILEKRQKAYESIWNLIFLLNQNHCDENGNLYKSYFEPDDDINPYLSFNHKIISDNSYFYWLTPALSKLINNLNIEIVNVINEIPESNKENYVKYAILKHQIIDLLYKNISRQYFIDLLELTNLKKFKKARIKEFKKLIISDTSKFEDVKNINK